MVVACCYLLTATILLPRGVQERRRYYGSFKIKAGSTRTSAASTRLERHIGTPVKWLCAALPDTLEMRPIGHAMSWQHALVEEAILSARAMTDGGDPCRGGPWANPHVGSKGREEAEQVCRLAARAVNAASARAAVIDYAQTLSSDSYLRRHIQNISYSDSAERMMGSPVVRKRRSGPSQSGNQKRVRQGLKPGTAAYKKHKWGADVVLNRRRDNWARRK